MAEVGAPRLWALVVLAFKTKSMSMSGRSESLGLGPAFGALCGWQLNCKIIIFITNLTTATTTIAVEDSQSVASNEMEINCNETQERRSSLKIPLKG